MIKLYQLEGCPFCTKVRSKLKELKIDYEKINVSYDKNDSQRKILTEKSGVNTVPVIEVDGMFMGESEEIIKYLEKIL